MKRTTIMVSALAIALSSGIALAGGGGKTKDEPTAATCDGSAAVACADDATKTCPAYDLVSPVTEAQAEIIMKSHYCEDMSVDDLAVMFMAAGLSKDQVQAQIDAKK
jgi:hypothetical protein